jgi:two-component system CheB/CheR fusion protein
LVDIFAVTSGMIALSARSAATPKEYAANIRGRLDALALAHELILPNPPGEADAIAQPTDLDTLLQRILSPYTGKRVETTPRVYS